MEVPMYRWESMDPTADPFALRRQREVAAACAGTPAPLRFRLVPTARRYRLAALESWGQLAEKQRQNARKPFTVNTVLPTLSSLTDPPALGEEVTICISIPYDLIWSQPARARRQIFRGEEIWTGELPGVWGVYQHRDPELDGWRPVGWVVEGWTP